ncbi:MAG: hypothetical protein ACQEXJ_07740 [Myxococcota bacterium]
MARRRGAEQARVDARVHPSYTPPAMYARPVAALLVAALLAGTAACERQGARDEEAPRTPARVRVTDRADRLAVVLPGRLVVHRFEDAVQATTADGAFRLYVRRTGPSKLLQLAGPGKDTLMARGWARTGEQHLERAIHVALQRGGTAADPEERREVWWVSRPGGTFVCDGVAARGVEAMLGETLLEICRGVELRAPPDAGEDADAGAAQRDGG